MTGHRKHFCADGVSWHSEKPKQRMQRHIWSFYPLEFSRLICKRTVFRRKFIFTHQRVLIHWAGGTNFDVITWTGYKILNRNGNRSKGRKAASGPFAPFCWTKIPYNTMHYHTIPQDNKLYCVWLVFGPKNPDFGPKIPFSIVPCL